MCAAFAKLRENFAKFGECAWECVLREGIFELHAARFENWIRRIKREFLKNDCFKSIFDLGKKGDYLLCGENCYVRWVCAEERDCFSCAAGRTNAEEFYVLLTRDGEKRSVHGFNGFF